jgi:dTMP kinase
MIGIKRDKKGLFVSIEGPDGAGKSTQARMLKERLETCGREVLLTREPGGTPIGEELRRLLLNPNFREMSVICEALLYSASRNQLTVEVIRPALEKKKIVISDRYLDSSLVYQGFAGGAEVEIIREINRWATGGLLPDLTFMLDLDAETGLQRSLQKSGVLGRDRVEEKALAFHRRVREGFLKLAWQEPQRIHVVSARESLPKIHDLIWERIQSFL